MTIFVFPVFRDSLLARIHWTTNFRSLLMCLLSFFNEFSVSRRLVSPAKWCTVEKSTALWKSLIKRIKRIGPNIKPLGNPILISLSEDLVFLMVVCCFLPSRNDLSHLFDLFAHVSLKVYHDLLCRRLFWSLKMLQKQIFQNHNLAWFFLLFWLKHD